jgi:CHAD domain-containing protein
VNELSSAAAADDPLTAALRELVRRFDSTESAMLDGGPDAVHQHRTVVRRIRGFLAVFGPQYDPSIASALRTELKEWGAALGVARDYEVRAGHVEALLDDADGADARAEVRSRIIEPEREAAQEALSRLLEIRDLERLRATRRRLHDFVEAPTGSTRADVPVDEIRAILRHEARRTLRRSRRIDGSLESYHALRKAARRLRHAIEAVTDEPPGLFGRRTRRVAKRAHRIQSILGDHRDALLLAEQIERARALALHRGEDVAVYDAMSRASRTTAVRKLATLDDARNKLKSAVGALK